MPRSNDSDATFTFEGLAPVPVFLDYSCAMPLMIQLHTSERKTAFNLKPWMELLAVPEPVLNPDGVKATDVG